MADRYWVGGAGTWDATTTTNWATTSGGAGGASAPTFEDNVIFDSLSNATAYTVTISTNAVCEDFTAAGPLVGNVTFFMSAVTSALNIFGSMTLPASNFTWSAPSGGSLSFTATTTGKTITTNGSLIPTTSVFFNGAGGEWTLGSAFTGAGTVINFTQGTFNTNNYNVTAGNFILPNNSLVRSVNLGSSNITLSGTSFFSVGAGQTNLTFDAGTSQINSSAVSPTFTGGGQTFYNVSFTSAAAGNIIIGGDNTFNDLTFTSRSATGRRTIQLVGNQTVNGTLTLGVANTAIRRIAIASSVIGVQRTITLNGALASLADVDISDINATGTAGTWTGTRLGDGKNNSGITFDSPKTVYWNLAGTQNWSATGWATTNNGTPDVNNFPLAQDTATFTEAGSAGTVTIDQGWWIGSIQMADGVSNRTTAFTLANGAVVPLIYGNITLFSSLTLTGTGILFLLGQGTTQTITSAGATFTQSIVINSPTGTVQLGDDLTTTFIAGSSTSFSLNLLAGTLDLNDNTANVKNFAFGQVATTRSVSFGTSGKVICSYSGNVYQTFSFTVGTGFAYTGTPYIEFTASDANQIAAFFPRVANGGAETNALNYYFTGGSTGQVRFDSASGTVVAKDITFSNFAGTFANTNLNLYGSLVLDSDMTLTAGTFTTTFLATSGTQQITTNGKTLDFPITQNSPSATVQLQENLTMGSTRTFTLTEGTLDLNDNVLTAGAVSTSNSNTRSIDFGRNGVINCEGGFTATTSTGLTTAGRGRIKMSSASAKTFAGGGANYSAAALEQAGAGTLTITGANTFDDITNSNATASQITFPANTTTSVRKLSVSGSSGNLVSLRSSTDGTKFTIQTV